MLFFYTPLIIIVTLAATAFLVFYRFKTMSKEEAQKAKEEWQNLKNGLPSGIELVGEYTHAWGTEYNGFLYLNLIVLIHF